MYGDTTVVRALARELREQAADIQAASVDLRAQSEAVPWTGLAADAMRRLARDHASGLAAAAAAHERAAASLDHHAREVDHVTAVIAAAERRVHQALDDVASGASGLAHGRVGRGGSPRPTCRLPDTSAGSRCGSRGGCRDGRGRPLVRPAGAAAMTVAPPEGPGASTRLRHRSRASPVASGARPRDMRRAPALAGSYDRAGDRMRGWAARAARVAADPGLLATAPLSPLTFAVAEAAVLEATSGIHGVLISSLVYEADARAVRATIRTFDECDRMVADAIHAVDYDLGRCVGTTLVTAAPLLVTTVAVGLPLVTEVGPRLPAPARHRLSADLGLAADAAQRAVDRHPALLQHAVGASGGLLDGALGGAAGRAGVTTYHPTVGDAAGDLALLYDAEGSVGQAPTRPVGAAGPHDATVRRRPDAPPRPDQRPVDA